MCVHKLTKLGKLDIDDFVDSCEYEPSGKRIPTSHGDLKILHHNIRGLNSKLAELQQVIQTTLAPNIILLSETWLKKHSPVPHLPGYKLERSDRLSKKGGGVCIFISDHCRYKRRLDLEQENNESLEACFIEVETTTSKLVVGSMYRPPNTNPNEFVRKLEKIIIQGKLTTRNLIIGLEQQGI